MINTSLRQLRIFDAVARHLSYTRAAKAMYLTQPAVSMQIKQLEENLGIALFEQVGKKIYLTEAGKELHHYSSGIAHQLAEAEAVLEELKGIKRGKLAVSVVSTAKYFAPYLLALFSKRYPQVTVNLEVTNRESLLAHLAANDRDMVIMGVPPPQQDFVAESFMENPLVVIAPYDHPLTQQCAIPLERLQQETFLIREPGSGTRIAMERFFSEHKVQMITGMEMNSNEAIKQGVQAGLGLGIVSVHTVALEMEVQRLAVLDVAHMPVIRHWYIVHRKDKRLSPVAQAFKSFVLKEARQLLELQLNHDPARLATRKATRPRLKAVKS